MKGREIVDIILLKFFFSKEAKCFVMSDCKMSSMEYHVFYEVSKFPLILAVYPVLYLKLERDYALQMSWQVLR
jgi:hypothetical protein